MKFIKEIEELTGMPFDKAVKEITRQEEASKKHKARNSVKSCPEFIDGFGIDHSDVAGLPTGY